MKKKLVSILAAFTVVFTLAACNNAEKADSDKKDETEKKKEVTLSYANWNLGTEEENNLERLLLESFKEEYPHIKIELNETVNTSDWNGTLATAASGGTMPDVFALPQIPLALSNDWLLDVTELASKDKDFEAVPEIVRDSAEVNGKLVALPAAQHFLGYFVNKDVFNAANLDHPEFDSSVEDFVSGVKEVTNVNNGVVGLNNPFTIVDWYPSAVNPDMGWYTLKDGQYALDSKEYINGVNVSKEFVLNGYAYDTLTEDQKAKFTGKEGNENWLAGSIGLWWDGTWAASNISEKAGFEWDFIGLPGGVTAIANDYLGISKTSKHPEEAYLFAKFMSFGKEGFMKRLEIADKEGKALNTLPITTDKEVLDEFFSILDVPGIRTAYENLDKAIVEPVKIVPGYVDARWEALTGVKTSEAENANTAQLVNAFVKGELKVEDYAKQLDELADKKSAEAAAALEGK
ncbi:ABC transporter substrate-binding protein [Bacillus sp. FJAT-18017]|uniref:ABC transporter substrate-binding protein n=1 Tax=Bacillus sp. FJAT-18017 TaxID=1705566 RepID=UPI0018D03D6B|nr:extracellular solute-binding protein [Bacillus sp. FJAT-18017]